MSDRKDDKVVEAYLKGDSDLSRRYQAGRQPEPPAHLDAAILQAARSAVARSTWPALRKWYVPLSLAAVVVIGVSVVFRMYDYKGQKLLTEPASDLRLDKKSERDVTGESYSNGPTVSAPAPQARQMQPEKDAVRAVMKNKVSEEPAIRAAEKQAPAGDLSQSQKETAMPQAQMAPQMGHGVDTPSPDKPDTEEEKARASALSTVPSGAERENQGQPAVVPAEAGKLSDTMPAKGGIMSETEWLANVRLLWAAGNKDEAVASLKRFLTAYPHYPHAEIIKQLPDDFDPAKYISEF